jgi:hypothetical protein
MVVEGSDFLDIHVLTHGLGCSPEEKWWHCSGTDHCTEVVSAAKEAERLTHSQEKVCFLGHNPS